MKPAFARGRPYFLSACAESYPHLKALAAERKAAEEREEAERRAAEEAAAAKKAAEEAAERQAAEEAAAVEAAAAEKKAAEEREEAQRKAVEEAAAAAESLQQQAGSLSERVSAFNIGAKATVSEEKPIKVASVNKNKHVAPVTAIKTQKKLAPKVPSSDDWESF